MTTTQKAPQDGTESIEPIEPTEYDALIIGAGFAGMYMLHKLREQGFTAHVYETGTDVGGTWYWNRYPGARCDVESLYYSYSFSEKLQQEWQWTERYPSQPEILRYAQHVADRFDLRRDISLETKVASAVFDEAVERWTITTEQGDVAHSQFLITAVGCLSASRIPDWEGIDQFQGDTFHTGRWPHEGVDFTGKRVGVIGTGSSAIQAIPVMAQQAAEVTVFQRTPNFSIPAHNHPLDPQEQKHVKAEYPRLRAEARLTASGYETHGTGLNVLDVSGEERRAEFDRRWVVGGAGLVAAYQDIGIDESANEVAAEYVREKIRAIVQDPETAALLSPFDHPIGTKRICVDTDYYATYNQDHVSLVNVRDAPIERITTKGLITGGKEYEFDAIVFATGYDAMTGPLNRIDIRGLGGQSLKDKWAEGPRTYLGVSTAGFPNMFIITGPGSPSVLSNMMVSIEQHVEWIADYVDYMRTNRLRIMEPSLDAENSWVDHVNTVANYTLYPRAASWYMGANIPGKPRMFMPYIGGVGTYREECNEVAASDYKGFVLTP